MKRNKKEKIVCVIDDCYFCGDHFSPGDGHCFIGRYNEEKDWYEDDDGGILIESLIGDEIQICPDCRKKQNINNRESINI